MNRSPREEVASEDDENTIVLSVILNCELTKSSDTVQLHFKSPPITPLELKKRIEEKFSIPSCVQTLHYQSIILKDSDKLQHTHFQSGDTFIINYPIEGNCEMVQNVIQWLREILELFQTIEESDFLPDEERDPLLSSYLRKAEDLIWSGKRDGTVLDLCRHLFYQWEDKRTYINKLFFRHEGGLDVLMNVYGLLVSKDWGGFGIDSEPHIYLENCCIQAIVNYTGTIPLCRQVFQLGALELCLQTLLRKKVWRSEESEIHPDSTITQSLENALIAVCK